MSDLLRFELTGADIGLDAIGTNAACIGPLLGGTVEHSNSERRNGDGAALASVIALTLEGPTTVTLSIVAYGCAFDDEILLEWGEWRFDSFEPYWASGTNPPAWESRGLFRIWASYGGSSPVKEWSAGPSDPLGNGSNVVTVGEGGLISFAGQSYQIPSEHWDGHQVTEIDWNAWRPWRAEHWLSFVATYGGGVTRQTTGRAHNHFFEAVTRTWAGTWFSGGEETETPPAPEAQVHLVADYYTYFDVGGGSSSDEHSGYCTLTNDAPEGDPLYGTADPETGYSTDASIGHWTARRGAGRFGDNVTRLASGTEYLVRTEAGQSRVHRRAGHGEDWTPVILIGSTGTFTRPPLGAAAGDRFVVRQARIAAEVTDDLGHSFAAVGGGEADPQVAALRAETELIALSADQPDGLMCGVRLSGSQLVAVDADGDTDLVASVSGGAQAVVFRGGDGRWEIVALDAGTLRSFVSAGVAARDWSQTASQALGAAAAGMTRMVGWRSRGGLDLLCGHHPTDGVYRVWYRPGADQAWQGPGLELPSLIAYPPYLYERPTGQIEFGYYDGGVWTRRVADHPAGTWSEP